MSKANTLRILQELKEQAQDFEWYPTTQEMINCIISFLNEERNFKYHCKSILDIGAGDGRVLKQFHRAFDTQSYMIELATKHIENYDFGFVIGRDFYTTSLIEKDVDLIFSNPPYSEYEEWASRIIKEGNAQFIVLILPCRWKNSQKIKLALSSRKSIEKEPKILKSFDFENAERKARAKVDIVLIQTTKGDFDKQDVFAEFLENEFGLDFDKIKKYRYEQERKEADSLESEVKALTKNNIIDYLVDKYNGELREFTQGLKHLKDIHPKLLSCLDIDKNKLIKAIKEQLKGLKALYWWALFNELEVINSKLIQRYRDYLSFRIASEAGVEFTKENIHSIVIWLIKNANSYIESSYCDFFDRMAREGNALKYKSNERFVTDEWRYNREDFIKQAHKLDYRIVITRATNDYEIVDMIEVIANNLGYANSLKSDLKFINYYGKEAFQGGSKGTIYTQTGEVLLEFKAYKNNNVHIKFNKDFMSELNLAVGKLRQWLRNKDEARAEFKGVKEKSLKKIFDKSLRLNLAQMPLCLGYVPEQENKEALNDEPSLF